MKLTILCDNNTYIDNYLLGEPALSFFIENEEDKILFDLGYSNVYKYNAKKLNIDLNKVNKIAFSHGHDDHTRGLKFFDYGTRPDLYFCSGCFEKKKSETVLIGCPVGEKTIRSKFNLKEAKEPVEISKNLFYLGPVPRQFSHENEQTGLYRQEKGKWVADNLEDDTALVYVGEKGLSVLTGCSHSGICNICEYAKKLFGKKIDLVIGGFHLFELNDKTNKTISYLKNENIKNLYPSHCTSLIVKSAMLAQGLNVKEVGSGLVLEMK